MQLLAPGANTALANAHCSWNLESGTSSVFGEYAAVALLAVNEKRQPMGDPALLHQEQSWMEWSGAPRMLAARSSWTGSRRAVIAYC